MAVTEWKTAGFGADRSGTGQKVWSQAGNITADDGANASSFPNNQTTNHLYASNFGLTTDDVPSDATIDGIEVRFEASCVNSVGVIRRVSLVDADGTTEATDRADDEALTTTPTLYTYGGPTDLMGLTIAAADVIDADFGFIVQFFAASSETIRVDYAQMRVHYTEAGGGAAVAASASFGAELGMTATATVDTGGPGAVSGAGAFAASLDMTAAATVTEGGAGGRDMTAAVITASRARVAGPRLIAEIETYNRSSEDTEIVRVWTGIGQLSWDDKTWEGVGDLGGISPLGETSDMSASGFSLSLSGVPSTTISLVAGNEYQGRPIRVWLALVNDSGTIIADPIQIKRGRGDVAVTDDSGETSVVTITAEDRGATLDRASPARYTHEFQQTLFEGDLGFEFVESLQNKDIRWGR